MTGWRKRQVMEMAKEAGLRDCTCDGTRGCLERFAELVRADEAEKYKWDVHSCGPTCAKVGCVAVRKAVEAEREEIAEFIEKTNLGSLPEATAMHYALLLKSYANAIRARGNT